MKRLIAICFLILAWCWCVAREVRFVNYGSSDGLSSNTVYSITQDSKGFLWLGTRNGLNSFDGVRFISWKKELPSPHVTSLSVDETGNLWVGTVSGLCVKDGDRFISGPQGHIRALLTDSDGYVWAALMDGTLFKLEYDKSAGIREICKIRYSNRFFEGDYPNQQIFEDKQGRLWLGGRLVHFQYIEDRQAPSIKYALDEGAPMGSYAVFNGKLYAYSDFDSVIGTYDKDGYHVTGRVPVSHASLLADSRGRLWAAGSYGLAIVNVEEPEKSKVYAHKADDPSSLSSTELYCIFEDCQGNVWTGGDNGLSVLCKDFQDVHQIDIPSRQITDLLQTRDGRLWLGTADSGAYALDMHKQELAHIDFRPIGRSSEGRVSCLYEDSTGAVYIGLWAGCGFNIWKDGKVKRGAVSGPIPPAQRDVFYSGSGSLSDSNWISDFLEDSRGRFWVVTWEGMGLNEWDRSTGRTMPPHWLSPFVYVTEQLDSNIYLSSRLGSRLMEDSRGNLVYATTESGLNIIDGSTGLVTKYLPNPSDSLSIPDNCVIDLCMDRNNTIWAATRNGIWSPSGERRLGGITVRSLEADKKGRLWAGTEEGLYFIDTDGSIGVAQKGMGFPSDIYGDHVSCMLKDGSLAFGGVSGAAYFHPDSLLSHKIVPEIFLSELTVQDAHLDFSFSVKNLPYAPLLKYRYRLKGVDEEWIYADFPLLQGRYHGLFPGRYTIQIQCTDLFGRWRGEDFRQYVVIRPPFLLRWYFILLYLIILVAGIWLIIRYRENRRRAVFLQGELDTRNRFFGIISHDLRNPISGIRQLSESLEECLDTLSPEKTRQSVHAIKESAVRVSDMLEKLLMWSVSQKGILTPVMKEENLHKLVSIMIDVVKDSAVSRGVKISENVPPELTIVTDRHMMASCLRNILSNAVKYAREGGNVSVSATSARIVITDDGPGMDEAVLEHLSRPGHLGLTLTKELLEKMNCSLSARNLPEGGCEMTIYL